MQRRPTQGAHSRSRGNRAAHLLGLLVALLVLVPGSLPGARPLAGARSLAQPASRNTDDYAVVVHPMVATSAVSMSQLREMFLGTRRRWDDGTPIVVIVQAPGTRTRGIVLRVLYRMDEGAFKRYWIARTLRGSSPDSAASAEGGPTLVSTDAMARRLTAGIPGAVAIVPASEVDAGVRVLRLDGRLPGNDGYPLGGGPP